MSQLVVYVGGALQFKSGLQTSSCHNPWLCGKVKVVRRFGLQRLDLLSTFISGACSYIYMSDCASVGMRVCRKSSATFSATCIADLPMCEWECEYGRGCRCLCGIRTLLPEPRAKKYVKHFTLSFSAHFWHGSHLACDLYVHVICVIYDRQDVCVFKLCAKCYRRLPLYSRRKEQLFAI